VPAQGGAEVASEMGRRSLQSKEGPAERARQARAGGQQDHAD
jgi:hypothetical protein